MKASWIFIVFSIVIIQVQLRLDLEERQELLDKLAVKVSSSYFEPIFDELREDDEYSDSFQKIEYNVSIIQELLKYYDLPENYSYFEETKTEPIVKDQGLCGSCWSFSATSSLAYRFHKLGLNLNLSPQDGISCYLPDCEVGNNDLDPQLNLVKNGSVTEGCLPYNSSDGKTFPECPSQCQDGSEFKRYYSQNAYIIKDLYQYDFNIIAIFIMDQLANEGPISASFNQYVDFNDFGADKYKCKNDVYSYNGTEGGEVAMLLL